MMTNQHRKMLNLLLACGLTVTGAAARGDIVTVGTLTEESSSFNLNSVHDSLFAQKVCEKL